MDPKEEIKTLEPSQVSPLFEKYMFVVGFGGQSMFFLQAATIFSNQSAENVSLYGFLASFIAVFSWVIYGIKSKNRLVTYANLFASFGALLVIIGILLFQ